MTALPRLSDRAFHFKAEDITPQTDNTTLAGGNWTDGVGGLVASQATSGNRPLYRTSRLNGLPALQFTGLTFLDLGRPSALITLLNRGTNSTGGSLCFVMGNLAAIDDGFNTFWSPSNVNDGRSLIISNNRCGGRGGPRLFPGGAGLEPPLGTGLQIIIVTQSSLMTHGGGSFSHNFNGYNGGSVSDPGSGNWIIGGVGSTSRDDWQFKGDMMELIGWNAALTLAEEAQAIKSICEKYGAAYPWASATHVVVCDGDSIGFGQGCSSTTGRDSVQNNWLTKLMQAKGQPWGAYTNRSVSGASGSEMATAAPVTYPGLATQLGKRLIVLGGEFYNQPDPSTTKAWTAAVKSADSTAVTCVWDSVDNANPPGDGKHDLRAAFNTSMASDPNSDVKVPMSTETHVGVEGSVADNDFGASTYFADGIHPNNLGNTYMASFYGSYYDAAVAIVAASSGSATAAGATVTTSPPTASASGAPPPPPPPPPARRIAIARPLDFALVGTANVVTGSNVLTPDPKEASTIASGTTGLFDIDLGAAVSVDTFLAGYLSANITTLRVQGGLAAPTEFEIAAPFGGQSSPMVNPDFHRPFVALAPVTARYLRFSLVSPGSNGTVGVIAVGLSIPLVWGHEFGSGRPIEDTGSADRLLSGGFGINEGVRVGGYQWTFGDLYDSEVQALYALGRDRGNTRSVIVIEDPTQSSGLNERTHWALFDRIDAYERQVQGASRYSFKVRDWA